MLDFCDIQKPCEQCPWLTSNQGKRTAWGFYTKANLKRLWRGLCGRLDAHQPQSCHLTDPSNEDHVSAGAAETAQAKECPGSVIVMTREVNLLNQFFKEHGGRGYQAYNNERYGLTQACALWWGTRGIPLLGGPSMPKVENDPEVGVPDWLAKR